MYELPSSSGRSCSRSSTSSSSIHTVSQQQQQQRQQQQQQQQHQRWRFDMAGDDPAVFRRQQQQQRQRLHRWRFDTAGDNPPDLGAKTTLFCSRRPLASLDKNTTNPWYTNPALLIGSGLYRDVALVLGICTTGICHRCYRCRAIQHVRYDINIGSGHIANFGTTSTPARDTSVSLVKHQCRYRTIR